MDYIQWVTTPFCSIVNALIFFFHRQKILKLPIYNDYEVIFSNNVLKKKRSNILYSLFTDNKIYKSYITSIIFFFQNMQIILKFIE